MTAPILEHMTALSDQTRCRMLLLLERHELTVSELCTVLQMPQSSVSRHLKTLADDDWVTSRRDGTSRFYSMACDDLDPGARQLWPLIREQVARHVGGGAGRAPAGGGASRGAAPRRRILRHRGGGVGSASAATCSATRSSLGRPGPHRSNRWSSATWAAARDSWPRPWRPTCGGSWRWTVRRTCWPRRARASTGMANVRAAAGRPGEPAARRRRAGRGGAVAGAALLAGSGARAGRGGPGGPAGRAGAGGGHAAARAPGVSAADGPRVARVFGEADHAGVDGRGLRAGAGPHDAGRPRGERAGAVRGGGRQAGAVVRNAWAGERQSGPLRGRRADGNSK